MAEANEADEEDSTYPGPGIPAAFFLVLFAVIFYVFASIESLEGDVDPDPVLAHVLFVASLLAWAAASVSLVVGLRRRRSEPGLRTIDILILAIGFAPFLLLV